MVNYIMLYNDGKEIFSLITQKTVVEHDENLLSGPEAWNGKIEG